MTSISPICKKYKNFISALKSSTYRDFMIKKLSKSKTSKSYTWVPLSGLKNSRSMMKILQHNFHFLSILIIRYSLLFKDGLLFLISAWNKVWRKEQRWRCVGPWLSEESCSDHLFGFHFLQLACWPNIYLCLPGKGREAFQHIHTNIKEDPRGEGNNEAEG